jgi:hypothetical protein
LAREAVVERGEEIEFGRYYSEEGETAITTTKYVQEDVGAGPTIEE